MTALGLPPFGVEGAITLVVGWKSANKVQVRRVNLGPDVQAALRDVATAVRDDVVEREVEEWTPEADSSPEVVLTLPADSVGPAPALAREVAAHGTLLAALEAAASLPPLKPGKIPAAELGFYAIVVGNAAAARTVWIRRTNPRRGLKRKIVGSLGNDVLEQVTGAIFSFDADFDLVVSEGVLAVLSQTAFRSLFRDNEALREQVPGWIADVARHLPMTMESQKVIEAKCGRDSRLRQRLEVISSRGHLSTVTQRVLRRELKKHKLMNLIDANGELAVTEDDLPRLLHVLNEDLFDGALTGTGFRSDKKAQR